MILWINGAYGVGKTTTAERICAKLPNSFLFDPEIIGSGIRALMPKALWKNDFQDHPSWRKTTVCLLKELYAAYDGTIVVPMTVVNPTYLDETIGKLEREGIAVRHFLLLASREQIRQRIYQRGEDESFWCAKQIDRCVAALGTSIQGIEIATDGRDPETVVQEIFTYLEEGAI